MSISSSDLTLDIFLILRAAFFADDGFPTPFSLRAKRNTQDDPLDAYIAGIVQEHLRDAVCHRAPGPLTSPDMVVFRPDACAQASRRQLRADLSRMVGIEVKKLERTSSGQVARSTGMDYNTTPPCGTMRVYDQTQIPLDIPGFYLFVCQEPAGPDTYKLTALALCDGDALNTDFEFYLSITGQRTKGLGMGSYADGVNRQRPMLIFANPLGAPQLDHAASLVSRKRIESEGAAVSMVYQIGRTLPDDPRQQNVFAVYRARDDVPPGWEIQHLIDPFPRPIRRVEVTQGRGKFVVPITPSGADESDSTL